jgi:hypothetical protein
MKRKPSQKHTRHELKRDPEFEALLATLVPVGEGAALSAVVGWSDREGNLRRARATWDNGWSADLFFTLPRGGKVSLSSYRVNWHGTIKGGAA